MARGLGLGLSVTGYLQRAGNIEFNFKNYFGN